MSTMTITNVAARMCRW